jgi:hypothetical protein
MIDRKTTKSGTGLTTSWFRGFLLQPPNEAGFTGLVFADRELHVTRMDLATATKKIETTLEAMRASYGEVVFDEWAIISLADSSWSLVSYAGPRRETFRAELPGDLRPLSDTSTRKTHAVGDFEFANDARGTLHDVMLRLGPAAYLIGNNTRKAMAEIRAEPRWLVTQRSFVKLSDAFRADPLTLAVGER